MSMIETRIKIIEEAETLGGHAKAIAEYITRELLTSEENAALVSAKKLSAAINHIKDQARKVAKDGMAMIEDNEVYGWIREFYGISDLTVAKKPTAAHGPEAPISIFDLMGE